MRRLFAVILFALLIGFIYYFPSITDKIYKSDPKNAAEQISYDGVLTIADTVKRTVAGARFGYINKIIYDFEKNHPEIRIELKELKHSDNAEIALRFSLQDNHPDIMPYYVAGCTIDDKYLTPTQNYEIFYDDLDEYFASGLKNGTFKALPVSYEVPVILINTDLLSQLNITLPERFTVDTFFSLLSQIDDTFTNDKLYTFDMFISKNNNLWQPFYLNSDLSKIASLRHIRDDLFKRSENDVLSLFSDSKTAVCILSVSQLRALQNMQNKGSSSDWNIYALPYEKTYISNISFYAALKTDDTLKENAINDFLKNLLSNESQLLLENIMHLPVKDILYEKYPYLNTLKMKDQCVLLEMDMKTLDKIYNEMIQSIP
jgi:ABC-type glycerol-3-phosphate transport system substrate-binding protein